MILCDCRSFIKESYYYYYYYCNPNTSKRYVMHA